MTVSDKVDVFNLAASLVPTRSVIAAVDEESPEAEALELWYEPTIKAVLRAARWPFATEYARLAVVQTRDFNIAWATATAPPPHWAYEYAAPSNMIRPRNLTSYNRFDLTTRAAAKTIATNEVDTILCYTRSEFRIHMWDDQFLMAIAHGLAAQVIMKLTGKSNRTRNALEIANDLIRQARATAANEPDIGLPETLPSWLAIRGQTPYLSQSNYLYPDGPFLSLTNEQ